MPVKLDFAPSRHLIFTLQAAANSLKGEFYSHGMWGNDIARMLYSRLEEDVALFTKMRNEK